MEIRDMIRSDKVIVISRKIYGDDLLKLAEALVAGGMRLMEVTFDQSDAEGPERTARAISQLRERFGDVMRFGAGTVLTCEQVETAAQAGAEYIISPDTNVQVIARAKALGLASIPGAMTPSEILVAHEAGADFVKLFPASYLGTKYIKAITAPISHVALIATGGITDANFGEFLAAGCAGAGVGQLADRKLIATGDFTTITERARRFAQIAKQ